MEKLLQASTLNALMLGNFDCTMSVGAFLRDADTGIGTYTGLDGEAIFEDGVAYRATADGVVTVMTAKDGVAFGTVSKFDASVPPVTLCGITSIETLKDELSLCIRENQNIFYMLKAIGIFRMMHVRSCYACEKPYPTLSEVANHQKEFHYQDISGSVIAVYCPPYVEGLNLPGWHFHFLSEDKTKGGHILGLQTDELSVQINPIHDWELLLPENPEFALRDLCEDLSVKTAAVEGGAKH